jgi:hypothetical protein
VSLKLPESSEERRVIGWFQIELGSTKENVRAECRRLRSEVGCTGFTVPSATTGRKLRTCANKVTKSIVIVALKNAMVCRGWRLCDEHGGLAEMELTLLRFLDQHRAQAIPPQ